MILVRFCIDCGKVDPDTERAWCCPDHRIFWMEKKAAEGLNESARLRSRAFDEIMAKLSGGEK